MSLWHKSITNISYLNALKTPAIVHAKDVNYDSIVHGGVPVIVNGLMEQEWLRKASFINKSSDLKDYLVKAGLLYGTCILPVEYGGNYMDPKMTKVNLDILEVLDYYSSTEKDAATLYLAQTDINDVPLLHDLLHQDPPIIKEKNKLYRKNIWLGRNTSSPLHYDPFHNFLVQLMGQKHVILYPPSSSNQLRAAVNTVQKNTSLIDFNKVLVDAEYAQRQQMSAIPGGYQATLSRGQAIYIPLKWWHYCRSFDTTAFNVNYWWL